MPQTLKSTLETSDDIQYELYIKGLSEANVRAISADLQEPTWMLDLRLDSLKKWYEMEYPSRGPDLQGIREQIDSWNLVFYARPKKWFQWYTGKREEVDPLIKTKFEKLGIPEAERKYLAWAWGQYDSEVVYHNIKERRAKQGVIFEDMSQALIKHEDIVKKYFMKLIPNKDHKFMALHGAVWSGGTFIYVPKGVAVTEPLQAYFRMNTFAGGQFEHTLIIIEDEATGDYIEGCSAPKFDAKSLHAWCVEVYVWKNAKMRYSSVENWSTNTYNLNTKRAVVDDHGFMEWINGNLGSCTTMLYPCSILKWDYAKSDQIGVVVAWAGQNQDSGSKVIHIGKHTSSTIISKSISKDGWISTYRGIVDILASAEGAVNATECDALLMDDQSISTTIPHINVSRDDATVAHEASAGKVDETQLFYMMSRGLDEQKAMGMIVNGFISPVVKKLPLEYAAELNRLIEMEMEGSVG
jgi:Fe-S cluster assembly protein SufB